MTTNVFVNLELVDSSLDAEDLQAAARNLLKQVRAVDGVEEADLVAVTDVPEGSCHDKLRKNILDTKV